MLCSAAEAVTHSGGVCRSLHPFGAVRQAERIAEFIAILRRYSLHNYILCKAIKAKRVTRGYFFEGKREKEKTNCPVLFILLYSSYNIFFILLYVLLIYFYITFRVSIPLYSSLSSYNFLPIYFFISTLTTLSLSAWVCMRC